MTIQLKILDLMFQLLIFMKFIIFLKDNLNKEISNKIFKKNIIKMMKLMIPFTPHLAHECLEFLNCKDLNELAKN